MRQSCLLSAIDRSSLCSSSMSKGFQRQTWLQRQIRRTTTTSLTQEKQELYSIWFLAKCKIVTLALCMTVLKLGSFNSRNVARESFYSSVIACRKLVNLLSSAVIFCTIKSDSGLFLQYRNSVYYYRWTVDHWGCMQRINCFARALLLLNHGSHTGTVWYGLMWYDVSYDIYDNLYQKLLTRA